MSRQNRRGPKNGAENRGIAAIEVEGFKSISTRQEIEIRPLTILAGANSSGKSSFMQPLLLMKQTLEASYDPGPLLLDGPNVKFTSGEQFISHTSRDCGIDAFKSGVRIGSDSRIAACFAWSRENGIEIREMAFSFPDFLTSMKLRPGMTHAEIEPILPQHLRGLAGKFSSPNEATGRWVVGRDRCFLTLDVEREGNASFPAFRSEHAGPLAHQLRRLIHVPGLRGNPNRAYPVTAVGATFPGTFENYVASVIAQWQKDKNGSNMEKLNRHLESLGLTWKVIADPITHTQVELRVGRLDHGRRGGAYDLVSIADVGFGVSQTLPVIVALLVAETGQMVYIEQPEIHLHPKAQVRMAQVLADAARRGVRVVAETHSYLLLKAVQTLVAEGGLKQNLVKLHWFARNMNDGVTEVRSADLDEKGAFGDWPEDFDEVELSSEKAYLDAAEVRSRA